MECLLLVDRGRAGFAGQQAEHLLLFEIPLDVAQSAGLVLCKVGVDGPDFGERGVMNGPHDLGDPLHLPPNERGRVVQCLGFREQILDVLNAVGQGAFLHAPIPIGVADDGHHVGMAQNILVHNRSVRIKGVVFHVFSSLVIIIFHALHHLSDNGVDDAFLFFGQRVEHVAHGLLAVRFPLLVHVILLYHFSSGIHRVNRPGIRMAQGNIFPSIDNALILFIRNGSVTDYGLDERARIGTGQNQTHFTDLPMQNMTALLFKLVGIDGQSAHISVLDQLFRGLRGIRVVKGTVSVNAFGTVLQQSVAQNIERVIVLMIPHQRDRLSVIVLESVPHDGPAVGAFEVCFGGPAAEIVSLFTHFDSLPPLSRIGSDCGFSIRPTSGPRTASYPQPAEAHSDS